MRQHHITGQESLPVPGGPGPRRNNAATIALLEQWEREDATTDAAAIAEAEGELSEFKASLNANRPPDRPVFP